MSTEYANLGFRVDSSGLLTADDRLKRVTRSGKQTDLQINSLSKTVGVAAAAFVSLGSAMAIINKTTAIARQFDVLNASLITATGSAEKAEAAFIGIQKLAENTPYDLAQVTDAFIKLKNLGLTPSEKAIMSYGNTASAMGKDLMQFIEAVADASTAEFERLKEFGIRAKNQGDTIAFTFQGTTKTVKNNAAEIEQYLMRIGEVEFDGAMTRRMETLDGAMSNFSDSWDAMFLAISQNGVGEAIEASVRTGTEYVKDFTQIMNESGHEIQKAGIAISSGIHTAFTQLGGFFDIIGEEIKFAISSPLDFVQGKIIDFLQFLSGLGGSALDMMGFDSSSIDAAIMNLEGFRSDTVTEHNLMLQKMRDDTQKELDQIESIYADMFHNVELNAVKMAEKRKRLEKESTAVMSESIQKQEAIFAKFSETSTVPKWMKDTEVNLDTLIDQVDNFGGAWTRTGNIIADSMGDAVSLLDDFASKMQNTEKLQADLTKERSKYADGTKEAIKIDESLARLQQESASAQIGAIGKTIGLSAQLFKENSKERKALHALEMGFMAVEIALAAEKAVVNAVSAVANQGQGDPYTAFGRIAAMIGIMGGVLAAAGIGFSGGGGGGNYSAPTGGAGTVLGDSSSQSSSISGASERMEDIQTDQLSELMAIRQSMSKLSSGIQNLAKSFATGLDFGDSGYAGQLGTISNSSLPSLFKELPSFVDPLLSFVDGIVGGIIGGFSSKKKKLIDSGITFVSQTMQDVFESGELEASMFQVIETTKKKFWGLSKSTSTSTETSSIGGAITAQMADIFGYIGDTVVAAAESLGMDAKHIITTGLETLSLDDALANFVIDIGDVSFADKTGEEIQKELEAIFSQQADLMAQYLVPSITEYQQVGEGAFETLQRVAYEQAVFNDALDRTGVSLKDLSSIMQIDIAQSIISLVGGVDEFTELANSFFENFYTEAEQFNYLQSSISDVFAELGVGMVASREDFRNLVEGIDLTTESGQQLYAALMQISPAMAEYFNTLDDVARDKLNLQIELLEKQGNSEKALALQRQLELESMDESLHALMRQIWALDDAARAERERAQAIAEAQALMDQKTGLRIRLLEAQGKTQEAVAMQRKLELSQLDESLHALQKQIWAQQDLNEARAEERQLLTDNVAFAEQQLEKVRRAEIDRINSTVDAAQEAYNAQLEIINEQRRAYDDLISDLELKISNAETALNASLDAEKAKYQAVISSAEESYRLQLDSINAQRDAYNSLISELEDKVSSAEKALQNSLDAEISKYNLVISSAEEAYNLQLDSINAQRDAYNTLISELEQKVSSAESALNASLSAELSMYDEMISAAKSGAQEQIDAINSVSSARIDALNAELSIASSVASKYGAASATFTASQALAAARAGDFSKAQNITSNESFTSAEQARISAAREAYALNEIGRLADAQVSDLERTISATESSAEMQIAAINKASENEVSKLEEQRSAVEEQVNAILGIDNTVLSLSEAIKQYQDSQSELDAAVSRETLSKLGQQEKIALDIYEQAKSDAEKQIQLLQSQVDTILGVDNSVIGLSDAIKQYQDAQSELESTLGQNTLDKLQTQEDLALSQLEQAKADANKQIELLQKQVDTVLGVDNSVLDLAEAIKQYQDAQSELDYALSQNTLEKLQAQEDIAKQALEQAKEDAQQQIDALNAQVDLLLNIDNSVSSVEEAIKLLLAEREALAEFENSLQEEQLAIQKLIVDSINSIGNKIEKGNELIGGGKTGTIINDPSMPIITPPIVIYPQAIKDHDVVEQIKMLRKELDNANAQIGANTADTASTVRKLEYLQSNQ